MLPGMPEHTWFTEIRTEQKKEEKFCDSTVLAPFQSKEKSDSGVISHWNYVPK